MKSNALSIAVAANVVLAAGLVYLWHDPSRFRWSEPEPVKPNFGEFAPPAAAQLADTTRFRETLERPVFSPTRRPAPREASGDAERSKVDPLKDLRLLGMYGSPGRGGAIVNHNGKLQRVPFGQKIGDWTVAGATGRSATLVSRSGEQRELQMAMIVESAPPAIQDDKRKDSAAAAPASAPREPIQPPASTPRTAAAASRNAEAEKQRLRERAERMNARRAERGLPPMKVD